MRHGFKSKPKVMLREGVLEKDVLGLLTDVLVVRFLCSDYRCHNVLSSKKTRQLNLKTKKVCLYLGSYSFAFGKDEIEQSKIGQISIDFGVLSFKAREIVIDLELAFKDKYGDTALSCAVEIVVLQFK